MEGRYANQDGSPTSLWKTVNQLAIEKSKENLPQRIENEFWLKERNQLGEKQRDCLMNLFVRLEGFKLSTSHESKNRKDLQGDLTKKDLLLNAMKDEKRN